MKARILLLFMIMAAGFFLQACEEDPLGDLLRRSARRVLPANGKWRKTAASLKKGQMVFILLISPKIILIPQRYM